MNYFQTSDLRCQGTWHFLKLSGPEPSFYSVPVSNGSLELTVGMLGWAVPLASDLQVPIRPWHLQPWLHGHRGHVALPCGKEPARSLGLGRAGLLPDF